MTMQPEINQTQEPLVEPWDLQAKGGLWGSVIGLWVFAALRMFTSEAEITGETIAILVGVLVAVTLLLIPLIKLAQRTKLIIDESGVWQKNGKKVKGVAWSGLQTAAVVQQGKNDNQRWIVLSTNAPEAVLVRKGRKWMAIKADEQVCIQLTEERRFAVEQYMNRTLPVFRL